MLSMMNWEIAIKEFYKSKKGLHKKNKDSLENYIKLKVEKLKILS